MTHHKIKILKVLVSLSNWNVLSVLLMEDRPSIHYGLKVYKDFLFRISKSRPSLEFVVHLIDGEECQLIYPGFFNYRTGSVAHFNLSFG